MKKLLALCLIFAISITSVFALDSFIGGYVDYAYENGKKTETLLNITSESTASGTAIGFGIIGEEYFSPSFGFGYKIGASKALTATENKVKQDISSTPLTLNTAIDFLYKYEFSSMFALEAGAGMSYDLTEDSYGGVKFSIHTFGVDLKVGTLITLFDNFAISAGANFGVPVYTMPIITTDNQAVTYDLKVLSFQVAPYIAFMYKF